MEPKESKTLLLVEDDATISDLLAYNLRHAGYEVLQAYDGRAGLEAALSRDIDLVIMDLMLPVLDGLAASKEIARCKPEVPIMVVTARGDRDTLLETYQLGADDFITKPFDLDELLGRIAARLRRAGAGGGLAAEKPTVDVGDLVLDSDARTARTGAGEVALQPKEHDLLGLLLSRPGHLFPREEILQRVWHQQEATESRSLDVYVRHLRVKLEKISSPVTVRTVRGVGYRLGPS